jgi:hypothetical protein
MICYNFDDFDIENMTTTNSSVSERYRHVNRHPVTEVARTFNDVNDDTNANEVVDIHKIKNFDYFKNMMNLNKIFKDKYSKLVHKNKINTRHHMYNNQRYKHNNVEYSHSKRKF